MNNKLSKHALIGLAFIASLIMIYFGVNFLKGVNVFKHQKQYYAVFDDVSKLLISSPVYVKGYQVGLINEIRMMSTEPIRFLIGINFVEELRITEGSYLEYGIDMFGSSTANLVISGEGDYLQPGDTLIGSREKGLMDNVGTIMPKTDSILMRVDSVLYTLNRLLSNPAWEQSIEGIGSTIQRLSHTSESLGEIVASLESDLPDISDNLKSVSKDMKEISGELNNMDIASTLNSIDAAVNNLKMITDKINSDDNSLGLLLNDTNLHDSLSMTINEATRLLEDIRSNPDRYLTIRLRLF